VQPSRNPIPRGSRHHGQTASQGGALGQAQSAPKRSDRTRNAARSVAPSSAEKTAAIRRSRRPRGR
jgi:hypothetical protein